MAQTYYAQTEKPPATMSVRELIARLEALPEEIKDLPAIFKSPLYGAFGSNTAYSLDSVSIVELPERRENYGPQTHYDEETGEEGTDDEDYEEVWHAWKGVVIE
ncbi:MAG TPA: hypothetical protein VJP88_08660 [Caulobacteraceae bacterium]|nr:hypothetical protein [Caulobacteraceae bacterium]